MNTEGKQYTCLNCKNTFYSKKKCVSRTPMYCSSKCYGETLRVHKKCKLCASEIENKHSVGMKNRVYCSPECQGKARRGKQLNEDWRNKISQARKDSNKVRGTKHYNWKGGEETLKDRLIQYRHKRRSSIKKEIPIEFLEKLFNNQDKKCFYCEKDISNSKTLEHLTPVSRGGDNDVYNLVYSCKSCNSKKRQQTLEEYTLKTKMYHLPKKWEILFTESI